VAQKLEPAQISADAADLGFIDIGLDADRLPCTHGHGAGSAGGRCDTRRRNELLARHGRHARVFLRRRAGGWARRDRLLVALPCVEQEEQREREYEEEDEPL
jgi:hypothetical protein